MVIKDSIWLSSHLNVSRAINLLHVCWAILLGARVWTANNRRNWPAECNFVKFHVFTSPHIVVWNAKNAITSNDANKGKMERERDRERNTARKYLWHGMASIEWKNLIIPKTKYLKDADEPRISLLDFNFVACSTKECKCKFNSSVQKKGAHTERGDHNERMIVKSFSTKNKTKCNKSRTNAYKPENNRAKQPKRTEK